jgi:AcrR family transcriptional regulator
MKAAYHHGNLRPALIAAALKELAREGLGGLSLRGVARRAGVSAPAVYRHFEDKYDLLAAVATECAERLAATIVELVENAPDHPLAKFRAQGIAIVRFAVAHPEHFRALAIPGLEERTPAEARARADAWNAAQRAALVDAQQRGLISDLPLDDLLLAANSTVMGLAHAIIEGRLGDIDEARAENLAIAVTRVLGVGLIPRDEPIHDSFLEVTKAKPARRG